LEPREAQQKAEKRRAEDRLAIEQLGGSELAIRSLSLAPPRIHSSERAQLCYDVSNAKTVTLDPSQGQVWPSHSRCVDLSPLKTTRYTLTMTVAAGKSTVQTVELEVR
jgi:hypothetical protein